LCQTPVVSIAQIDWRLTQTPYSSLQHTQS
jgi:hypothetical protein